MSVLDADAPERPLSVEREYRVRFDEATSGGVARPSALLGYLQDVAWLHSEVLGFSRSWYAERGLLWVVRAVEMEVREPIPDGGAVRISTRIVGYRRVMARRRSELTLPDGRPAGHALVDWVMTDGRTPVRIPPEITTYPGIDLASFTPLRADLPAPPAGVTGLALVPRLRELDPFGHANNGVYVDWLDEAVVQAGGEESIAAHPRRYTVEYLRAAGPGMTLRSAAWPDGRGWAWRLAGAAGGDELARGRVEPA